jgi:hypothetical protein
MGVSFSFKRMGSFESCTVHYTYSDLDALDAGSRVHLKDKK